MYIGALAAVALVAFAIGYSLSLHFSAKASVRAIALVLATLAAIPWGLFVAYFMHILDVPWYFEWRTRPSTDWLPSLTGLTVGLLCGRWRDLPRNMHTAFAGALTAVLLVGLAHAKPLLMPLPLEGIHDSWKQNVCLQSTRASCGPCSAATVLRTLGYPVTERQLAAEAHTSMTGTFNWLLVRAIRARGLSATYRQPARLDDVLAPAIVGVRLGGVGHFVACFGQKDGRYLLGDPLEGPLELGPDEFVTRYQFDRFAIEIAKHPPRN
jgi:hypothetical protein